MRLFCACLTGVHSTVYAKPGPMPRRDHPLTPDL
jgi:hypothetical protein